jgi:hypothetical protein
MRSLTVALLATLVQTAAGTLPPPYPRPGAVKILDNDRVQVWNIAWLKGQPTALHRHVYDLVGVYYESGDRTIVSPEGARRAVSTKAWDIAFQRAGLTHIEEGVSEAPLRAVFVELKLPGSYGVDAAGGGAAAFPGEGATARLDNDRVAVWKLTPAHPATPHRHTRDAVVVAIDGRSPRAVWIQRGTVHGDEGAGNASRLFVFEIK